MSAGRKKPPTHKQTAAKLQAVAAKIESRKEEPASLADFKRDPKELGRGTYGYVVAYTNEKTKEKRAVKIVTIDTEDGSLPASFVRETSLLIALRGVPGIISYYDCLFCANSAEVWLVLEHMDCDLYTWIRDSWDSTKIRSIMKQFLEAIKACHNKDIVHRDLKPHNILLRKTENGDLIVKIADFGLARQILSLQAGNVEMMCDVVTAWYRDPQLFLDNQNYGYEIDLWSIGCIFGELLTRKPIFSMHYDDSSDKKKEVSKMKALEHVFSRIGVPDQKSDAGIVTKLLFEKKWYHKEAQRWRRYGNYTRKQATLIQNKCAGWGDNEIDLFIKLLDLNPVTRMTAAEALQHPYFTSVIAASVPLTPPPKVTVKGPPVTAQAAAAAMSPLDLRNHPSL
jgi:serine/threonine protein kinase